MQGNLQKSSETGTSLEEKTKGWRRGKTALGASRIGKPKPNAVALNQKTIKGSGQ